ncbi:Uncharacterised protein [Mycobacterium tuberculosis]|nr:Uncharacterised protein [Mycobacterium tuberculosis]
MAKYRYRKFPMGCYADEKDTLKYICTLHKSGDNWIAKDQGVYGSGKTRDQAVDDFLKNRQE